MKRLFIIALTLLTGVALWAAPVSGVVRDASGEPMIGVSVMVQGTTQGTITDLDGNYSIDVDASQTLEFVWRK